MAVVIASLALAGLVLACAGQAPGGTASPSASPSAPAATVPGSGAAVATASASAPTPGAAPPQASLAAEGGDPVIGQLGTFTWADGGSDSPWLPGTPATVGAGEPLTISLADGVSIEAWSAKRVPAGTTDGAGAVGLGSGVSPATFKAPGPGSWSVQVQVTFAGNLGAGAYYWQLTVR
jgi:hypothetical protein